MDKNDVFAELTRLGVGRAHVEFSGGHDEGGVDSIWLYSANDPNNKIEVSFWDSGKNDPRITSELISGLSAPVYDRYYSFAGEFSVQGTVIWDAAENKVYFDGQESQQTYIPIDPVW